MSRFRLPRIHASEITPEPVWKARRRLLLAATGAPLATLAGCAGADEEPLVLAPPDDGPQGFRSSEELTRYEDASSYNNFYEFGTGKADPLRHAHACAPSPGCWWSAVRPKSPAPSRWRTSCVSTRPRNGCTGCAASRAGPWSSPGWAFPWPR